MFAKPSDYKGNADFEEFLIKEELPLSVWPIRSFLMALLLAPEAIAPSWILDEILLKDTEDEVVFRDTDQYEQFMSKFMSLWNHLAQVRQGLGSFNLAPLPETIIESEADFALNLRSDELTSFLTGLIEGGSLDKRGLSKNFTKAVESLEDTLIVLESVIEDSRKDLETVKAIFDETQKLWKQSFSTIRKELVC